MLSITLCSQQITSVQPDGCRKHASTLIDGSPLTPKNTSKTGPSRSSRASRLTAFVCSPSHPHLYSRFVFPHFFRLGASTFHAQAHIPAQPAPPVQETRLPFADENARRPEGFVAAPRQRAQTRFRETWIPRVAADVPCVCSTFHGKQSAGGEISPLGPAVEPRRL
jgi:hypothetical protein